MTRTLKDTHNRSLMKSLALLLSLAFIILLPKANFAQTSLRGQVQDAKGEGVSYTQMGINGTRIMKLSDAKGNFTIDLPKSTQSKTLSFLAPGYKTASYPIDSLLQLKYVVIRLVEDVQQVTGTSVKSAKLKTKEKGNRGPVVGAIQTSLDLGQTKTSYGIMQKVPGNQAMLRAVSFHVTNDTLMSFIVRPFAYAISGDTIDYSRNLITQNRIFSFETKKGWLRMDLNDMDVSVSGLILFGVEWLAIDGPPHSLTSISLTMMGGRNSFDNFGFNKMVPYKGIGSYSIKGTFEYY